VDAAGGTESADGAASGFVASTSGVRVGTSIEILRRVPDGQIWGSRRITVGTAQKRSVSKCDGGVVKRLAVNQRPSVGPRGAKYARLFRLIDDDRATLHDPPDVADCDVYIGHRIAFHGDDIGEIAWSQSAEFFLFAEQG